MPTPEKDGDRVSRLAYSLAFALSDWRLVAAEPIPETYSVGYGVGYQAGALWATTNELARATGIPQAELSAEVERLFDSRPYWDTGIQFGRTFKEWVTSKVEAVNV